LGTATDVAATGAVAPVMAGVVEAGGRISRAQS